MKKNKFKTRLKNIMVWVYVVANAILISGTTLSIVFDKQELAIILGVAEVLVNIFATIDNPDFKGALKDKEYILDDIEEAVQTINKIEDAVNKSNKK